MPEDRVNVLIVDDHPENLVALEAVLDDLGQNLMKAHSGDEALHLLLLHDFALILLDVDMPGLDGFETARMIRMREKSRHIPIIFLTAVSSTDQQVFEGYSVGAVDYITKPFVPEILRSKVQAFVDLYSKTMEVRRQAELLHLMNEELKCSEKAREQFIHSEVQRLAAQASERRSAFLAEAARKLATTLDYEKTVNNVSRLAIPELADWCFVILTANDTTPERFQLAHVDPEKEALARQIDIGIGEAASEGSPVGRLLRGGTSTIIPDISPEILRENVNERHFKILSEMGCRSAAVVPLSGTHANLGIIGFVSGQAARYRTAELLLGEELGRRIALALENARMYEQMQAANRAKDEFLATLSHELRTPLNAIVGWIQILRKRQADEATLARALEVIERNAKAQAVLVEDMLDVSRIITGKLGVDLQPVSLQVAIEGALDAVRPAADAKGVHLQCQMDAETGIIAGDPSRLRQIVWNLLSNAVKFTPSGGWVSVKLQRGPTELKLTVADNGKGITPQFLRWIFDRFRQAEPGSSRTYGGLGLGLAITRHLVELHGGSIECYSEGEGKGAIFTVTFPLRRANADAAASHIAS